jgi:flagellar basal-body rod protein FlgG
MSQSLFSAKTGIRAQQQRLDIIGNNLSNANTNGYKSVRADFKDALYQTLRRPVQPQDELNLELGHGTLLGATMRDFNVGSMQNTGSPLDAMITGDGFFIVQSPQGDTQYTRNGTFLLSNEADGMYLVDGNGWYVLGDNGERIRLETTLTETDEEGNTTTRQANLSELVIDTEGNLYFGENEPFARLGARTFDNLQGLEATGSSNFIATVESGEARALDDGVQIKQGYLEMSGTDLASEMTRMIRTQRAMQLSSRALTTADQMMGIANTIRR